MHDFAYKKSELFAERVPVKDIVKKAGTPLYIYSHKTITRHIKAYKDAFKGHLSALCYAVKANPNTALLRLMAKKGCGADVISGGELFIALKAGIPAKKIVYAGVGKTKDEIIYALKSGILMFNVESSDELIAIDNIAGKLGVKAPIALRVNPDISAGTHPYISTGLKKHKFGIPIEKAFENYRLASSLPNVHILGIHKHIGSQITRVSPFVDALKKVLLLTDKLRTQGIKIQYLDIGGGLGIPYSDESPPNPKDLAKKIVPLLRKENLKLIIEPGRSITGSAGILITKVLYLKKQPGKEFVIVDAGMNDLLRPSLYDAFHNILSVKRNKRSKIVADIVGPVCESADFFAKERKINRLMQGDLLAIMSAGAYAFSMSSTYNSRPRVAEVLVKGNKFYIIRIREQYKDLIKNIKIPKFLK